MTVDRGPDYLISLVHEPRKLPNETGRTEFPSQEGKTNNRC